MSSRSFAISGPAGQPPVIIIGAHRSGTTATARALETLGLQMGQRLDSHHESKAMQRLHERYLGRVGAAWHKPEPFLDWLATPAGERDCVDYLESRAGREFGSLFSYRKNPRGWWLRAQLKAGASWGWKEPRTTLFAPAWLHIFPQALWLEVVRHPLAVALSIRQREMTFRQNGDPPAPGLDRIDYCLQLALTYVGAGERLAARTPQYRRLRFETLQAETDRSLTDLAAFCRLQPSPAQLATAAASIRPPADNSWPGLSADDLEQILPHRPLVAALGYELPLAVAR